MLARTVSFTSTVMSPVAKNLMVPSSPMLPSPVRVRVAVDAFHAQPTPPVVVPLPFVVRSETDVYKRQGRE